MYVSKYVHYCTFMHMLSLSNYVCIYKLEIYLFNFQDEEIHEAVNTVNSKRDAVVSNRDLSASG